MFVNTATLGWYSVIPNNWKLDREAYPIFEEAAKEAAWNTKHVDTDEALVVTIPVSIVMLPDTNSKKR